MFSVSLLQVGAFSHGKIDDGYTDDFVAGALVSSAYLPSRAICACVQRSIFETLAQNIMVWSQK